jgi:hypothetical protein
MAEDKSGRKVDLKGSYIFNGVTYGPGKAVSVPAEFPEIDGDTGDVIHPEGSKAAMGINRSFSTPANTGGVNTGETSAVTSVDQTKAEKLEGKTKEQLQKQAEKAGVTVTRVGDDGQPEDGEPLKRDYVRVLASQPETSE